MSQNHYYGNPELLGWSNKTYKRRRERERVAELNEALARLKQFVPSVRELPFPNRGRGHDRLTKVGILRAAVGYIRQMQDALGKGIAEDMRQGGGTGKEEGASPSELCISYGMETQQFFVCEPTSPLPDQNMKQNFVPSTPSDWRVTSTTTS